MKNKFLFSVVLIYFFMMESCVNPFGKGTWSPLPFKKMQKNQATKTAPADSTLNNGK